jgi:Na+-driven multidrug efflux pump
MITRLGVEGVAAITIVNYMLLVGLMIAYGIGESLQPIVSQCLGAKLPQRIKQYLILALACCLTVGVVLSALLLLAPVTITELFLKADEQATMQLALQIILLFWPAFLFSGMNITLSSYFTAMHKPLHSVFIALLRSLLLPVICLLSLPLWLGDTGVYISIPIAEGLTFIVAITLTYLNRPEKLIRFTV